PLKLSKPKRARPTVPRCSPALAPAYGPPLTLPAPPPCAWPRELILSPPPLRRSTLLMPPSAASTPPLARFSLRARTDVSPCFHGPRPLVSYRPPVRNAGSVNFGVTSLR